MLVLAHNLAQTAPDTIANHRASQATRGNEADATQPRILDCRCAEYYQFSVPYQAVSFYALVLGRARQATRF